MDVASLDCCLQSDGIMLTINMLILTITLVVGLQQVLVMLAQMCQTHLSYNKASVELQKMLDPRFLGVHYAIR